MYAICMCVTISDTHDPFAQTNSVESQKEKEKKIHRDVDGKWGERRFYGIVLWLEYCT